MNLGQAIFMIISLLITIFSKRLGIIPTFTNVIGVVVPSMSNRKTLTFSGTVIVAIFFNGQRQIVTTVYSNKYVY